MASKCKINMQHLKGSSFNICKDPFSVKQITCDFDLITFTTLARVNYREQLRTAITCNKRDTQISWTHKEP